MSTLAEDFAKLEALLDWARENKAIIQICWHHFRVDGPPDAGCRVQRSKQAEPEDSALDVLMQLLIEVKAGHAELVKRTREEEVIAERNKTEALDAKKRERAGGDYDMPKRNFAGPKR